MKATHIISSLDIRDGGPSRSVPTLCTALARQGVTVSIETLHTPTPIDVETLRGVQVHFSHESFRTPLRLSAELKKRTDTIEVDLLHGHGLWQFPVHYAMRAGRRRRIPTLLAPRGMLEPGAMQFSRWKKSLARALFQWRDLKGASCLHATAEAEAETLRNMGFRQPICTIPNGIALPPEAAFRTPSGAPDRVRTMAFLSRIHPKKGLPMLLAAWQALQRDFPGWRLAIAGTDENGHEGELKRLAARRGMGESVLFKGPLYGADKAAFLREADLFVLPTLSENFGIVVAEALAHGTPVVTTKGAPWQILEDRRAGWWSDVSEPALVDTLRRALSVSDDERYAMGQRGRRLVEDCYSTGYVAGQMLAVYKWLCKDASRPECVQLA